MARSCRRNACHRPAVASLTFRYDTAEVRLGELEEEPHPQRWELCPAHAASMTVPRGWSFVDERSPEPVAAGELARDTAGSDRSSRRSPVGQAPDAPRARPVTRSGAAGRGGSRYDPLRAELPRLAAELARARHLAFSEAGPPGAATGTAEVDVAPHRRRP